MRTNIKYTKLALILLTCSALTACGASERIANIGKTPELSKIENPTTAPQYQPVSLPMPAPQEIVKQKNSLWKSDRVTFFEDQRANDLGDILTVLIDIDDKAELENETERTRNNSEQANLDRLLGLEAALGEILPEAILNTNLTDLGSTSTSKGTGSTERDEKITVRMAALITQILPNGNMVIHGRQEVVVNFEKRILQVDGVIRPEDITPANTVSYDQIAEARIIYGGEGQITDVQQPRYGQQLYDIIFPF